MADFFRGTIGGGGFLLGIPTASAFQNHVLDANTDTLEFGFNAPEAITITKVFVRYGLRTGTPPAYKISLMGMDGATGRGDGTILGGGSPASNVFTPPADTTWDGTGRWITLDNPYICTRGQKIVIHLKYESGTVDGSNNSSFTRNIASSSLNSFPGAYDNGSTTTQQPIFGYGSTTKVYGYPLEGFDSTVFGSGDTPDEWALKFTLPADAGSTFKVSGVRARFTPGGSGRTAKVQLYTGTTLLQTVTIDADEIAGAGGMVEVYFTDTTLATLDFGTAYRIGLQPQEASNWNLPSLVVDAANDLTAFGGGADWHLSTRTDVGAWTDVTTKRPMMELIIDDWTEPAGGGGSANLLHGKL